jgi:glycosyltransferase involved in cell wall biosynthesis
MNISVLLATLKRPDLLEQTLKSFCALKTDGLEWEVLVVDNGDDEKTRDVVSKYYDRLPVKYLLETSRGKNHALNSALARAQGELFVFTDDDVVPECDWLVETWEGTKRWPQHSVFGGRILPKFPDVKALSLRYEFVLISHMVDITVADWDIPEGCYDAANVWGPNMAIRASLFKEGWRFDTGIGPDGTARYVMGSETELTMRLERAGFRSVYLPDSVVHHQVRTEQLEKRWLYRRSFRIGGLIAYREARTDSLRLHGIPLYLIKRMAKTYAKYLLSLFSNDKKLRFERRLLLSEVWGAISWHRNSFSKPLH